MTRIFSILSIAGFFLFVGSCRDVTHHESTKGNSLRISFSYRMNISAIKGKRIKGKLISIWVPYPAENHAQTILKSTVSAPFSWKITKGKRYGNRMVYLQGRANSNSIHLKFDYDILRRPSTITSNPMIKQNAFLRPALYLGPNKLLPNIKLFADIADKQIGPTREPKQIIKALYDYVVASLAYDKSGKGWGKGDPVWTCTNKRGNCTDFHSLLIALARSRKIPARFMIGFPIPEKKDGEIGGYHCWAEVYNKKVGWMPLDATDGKKSGRPVDYFGKLPANRIHFTTGRDIKLVPPQKQAVLNYFIYPYAEIDGEEYKEIQTKFFFKRI